MPAQVATRDEINRSIERVRELVQSGRPDEAVEVTAETRRLIRSITGRGSASAKRSYADKLSEAISGTVTRESVDIDAVRGMLDTGAHKIADGIRAFMSTADLAREIGRYQLQIHMRLHDRDGYPDIRAGSKGAKEANRALYERAGKLVEGEPAEVGEALAKLVKAVHNHKSDVRAEWLRSLDDPDNPDREFFEPIRQQHPRMKLSNAVAAHYGFPLRGRTELEHYRYGSTNPNAPLDVRVTALVSRMRRDLAIATPDELAALPESMKADIRRDLRELHREFRTILAAVK